MAWRKAPASPAAGTVAELEAYADEYERAAGTDHWAAGFLVSVRSWLGMLRAAGGDPEVGELFLMFARDDRAVWEQARHGVAQAG